MRNDDGYAARLVGFGAAGTVVALVLISVGISTAQAEEVEAGVGASTVGDVERCHDAAGRRGCVKLQNRAWRQGDRSGPARWQEAQDHRGARSAAEAGVQIDVYRRSSSEAKLHRLFYRL